VATSGPELFFVAFPAMLGMFDGAVFFSIVFFFMALCLGVDSAFGFIDFYIAYIHDAFPIIKQKVR
jgi:SNF family Na+-dependent transporter